MVGSLMFVSVLVLVSGLLYVKFTAEMIRDILDEYERMAEEGELSEDSGGGPPWT